MRSGNNGIYLRVDKASLRTQCCGYTTTMEPTMQAGQYWKRKGVRTFTH